MHELVIAAGEELRIQLKDFHGRPDAYVINGAVGLLLKHSAKRITPWTFTFMKEHIAEFHAIRQLTKASFVGFICGDDGFVCVRDIGLVSMLTPTAGDVASVRVERRARHMYRLSSGGNDLDGKVARGVDELLAAIKSQQNTECALPSFETSEPHSSIPEGSA